MPTLPVVANDDLSNLRSELDGVVGYTNEEIAYLRVSLEEQELSTDKVGVSKLGDLWILGSHKLLCGDSLKIQDVSRLMGKTKSTLVVTDPPYGVKYSRGQFCGCSTCKARRLAERNGQTTNVAMNIVGDTNQGVSQMEFIRQVFEVAKDVCTASAAVYMFSASMREGVYSMLGLAESGVHLQSQLIWVKNCMVMGQADYQWRHEVLWYGWFDRGPHRWFGGRTLTTVLDCRKLSSTYHPNEKPVELVEGMIVNSSLPGEVCYEPFSGSGTMFIACERTRRVCYGMEIDPHFCDVALQRWASYTKHDPVREDGAKFSDLARAAK